MLYLTIILIHELWLCLQHSNILLNPLCQRLDRNYGIALLKKRMAWVISLTLGAYWSREILSMFIAMKFVTDRTKYMIITSIIYHSFKSINVCIDAWRNWSPKIGIMRLLLDYWHWDSFINCLISIKRLFLQAFDTYVHAMIVYDISVRMNQTSDVAIYVVITTSVIWMIHAIAVQISQKSTATFMVELYKTIAIQIGLVAAPAATTVIHQVELEKYTKGTSSKRGVFNMFLGRHFSAPHMYERDCQVCRLLAPPVPEDPSAFPDVVFLVHPSLLSSAFAFWFANPKLKPIGGEPVLDLENEFNVTQSSYWRPASWMSLFDPFVWLISFVWWPLTIYCRQNAYVVADRVSVPFDEGELRSEVWLSKTFLWQYLAPSWHGYCRSVVLEAVRQARDRRVKVVGLGALNKAHFLNHNGADVVAALAIESKNSDKNICVVNGNTLTAAVAVDYITRYLEGHVSKYVILTGATSCVGKAVVAQLLVKAPDIILVCVSTSSERIESIRSESGFRSARVEHGGSALDAAERFPDALWVVGKASVDVITCIPYAATAMVFGVPNPLVGRDGLSTRPDLRIFDIGVLEVPPSLLHRCFNVLLPRNLIYSCHAAAIVHCLAKRTTHEVGEVNLASIDTALSDAVKYGFRTAGCFGFQMFDSVVSSSLATPPPVSDVLIVDVAIIGGGASGLATAAKLSKLNHSFIVLDEHKSPQGSWLSQYGDLELTSRFRFSQLPFLPIDIALLKSPSHLSSGGGDDGAEDGKLTAEDYSRYLKLYSRRLGLDRRTLAGVSVLSTRQYPATGWELRYQRSGQTDAVIIARCLVAATGKLARPVDSLSVRSNLNGYSGAIIEAREAKNIKDLAARGAVLLVGFGNSSVDIATAVVKHSNRTAVNATARAKPSPVHISCRRFPPVMPRQWHCLSVEAVSLYLLRYLPVAWADSVVWAFYRCVHGPSYSDKLPDQQRSPDWYPYEQRRVPPIDKGSFVDAVRSGDVVVHRGITGASGRRVFFAESTAGGAVSSAEVDTVVLCLGYESSLEWLPVTELTGESEEGGRVLELSVVAESRSVNPELGRKDGIFFVGFSPGPALVPLAAIGDQAARTVAEVTGCLSPRLYK